MTVTSKEVYPVLRAELAPQMKAAGFRRLKTGVLGWTRPRGQEYLTLWFQCDHHGWFADFGSSFTLEFQLGADAVAGSMTALRKRERFGPLLSAEDRDRVRLMSNRILEQLPGPGPTDPAFITAYRPETSPYPPHRDIWLHYAAKEHVAEWAAFFRPRMLDLVSSFEKRFGERANAG